METRGIHKNVVSVRQRTPVAREVKRAEEAKPNPDERLAFPGATSVETAGGAARIEKARAGRTTAYHDLHAELARAKTEDRRLLEGVGEATADWQRLNIAGAVALEVLAANGGRAWPAGLLKAAGAKLAAHGLALDDAGLQRMLARLISAGVLAEDKGGYRLAMSPQEAALKIDAVAFISGELTAALRRLENGGRLDLFALLGKYAAASERWLLHPVEARWPFLKAVALLPRADQERLVTALAAQPNVRELPLIDSMLLMITGTPPADWLAKNAPHLAGGAVYTVAAEGWFAAGGLGRVQQYHSAGMKALAGDAARVVTIEPYYAYRVTPGDTLERVDYTKLPVPVQGLGEKPELELDVTVRGKKVKAQAYRGTNKYGVEVWLLKDAGDYYTRACYQYGKHGTAGWEEFTEFMSRGALELIKKLEARERARKGENYHPAAIIANDGQLAPLAVFKRELDEVDPVLKDSKTWMTTHTYRNRGIQDVESGKRLLRGMHLPERWWHYFWRIDNYDVSSAGVRAADGANAVSAVHRDEVAHIDPAQTLLAITNGDDRAASSRVFRAILAELYPHADPEHPLPAQISAVKRVAKQRLGLDPERIVISYSGRLVGEKAGRERAFTDENLTALVREGAQVVIYGNVQAGADSRALYDRLVELSKSFAEQGLPGRLVVRTGWGIAEQVELLAATDVQVQDSDRGTGAAEYSEADVAANGGLQLGPPWIEGIIQRQGVPLDRTQPGSGNTIVPADGTPRAYLDALRWCTRMFDERRGELARYQAASVEISRVLEALLPGAEYLRQLNRTLD